MSSNMFRRAAALPAVARGFSTSSARPLKARMTLIGNLGGVPEMVSLSDGVEAVRYRIAVNNGSRQERDKNPPSWFNVTKFFGRDASPAQKDYYLNLTKGSLIYAEGDASMRTYTDAQGNQKQALNIRETSMSCLKRRNNDGEHGESGSDLPAESG